MYAGGIFQKNLSPSDHDHIPAESMGPSERRVLQSACTQGTRISEGGRYHSPSITPAAIRTLYPSCFLSHVATQLAAIVDVHTLRSAHSEPSKSTNQRRKHNPPGAEKLNSEILCTLTLKRNDNRCPRKRPPLKSPQHLTQRYETAAEEPVTTATI